MGNTKCLSFGFDESAKKRYQPGKLCVEPSLVTKVMPPISKGSNRILQSYWRHWRLGTNAQRRKVAVSTHRKRAQDAPILTVVPKRCAWGVKRARDMANFQCYRLAQLSPPCNELAARLPYWAGKRRVTVVDHHKSFGGGDVSQLTCFCSCSRHIMMMSWKWMEIRAI